MRRLSPGTPPITVSSCGGRSRRPCRRRSRRRGAAAVTALTDTVHILKGQDNLTLYSFGTKTAQHCFCKTCGIYTHHQRRSDPAETGINLGCIDGVNPRDFEPIAWVDGVNHPSDRSS